MTIKHKRNAMRSLMLFAFVTIPFFLPLHAMERKAKACDTADAGRAGLSPPPNAVSGRCLRVVDGDTVDIETETGRVRLRLHGVDAPERGQPFSKKATRFVRDRIDGEPVSISYTRKGKAAWNRGEGIVYYKGDRCLNSELLEAGLAVLDERFCDDGHSAEWARAQEVARRAGNGFWSQADPVFPWEKREEAQRGDAAAREKRRATAAPFVGNRKSRVFHNASCPGSRGKNCTNPFDRREDALASGYRPCGRCRP